MSLLKGRAPYWQRLHEQNRAEVFAQVESYPVRRRARARGVFFGRKEGTKLAGGRCPRPGSENRAGRDGPKNLVNRGLLCAGNPDTCIKALERFEELGVDLILCFMEMGRVPHTKSMESFKLFGKYVIPHFKGRTCWYTSQLQGAPHPAPPAAAGSK
jgi:alkanesulfonate monooxygenase SsuD/methylene tetrahydromethanopterin reductase-like flavin-dependent oxidoreductase (luciferase family)